MSEIIDNSGITVGKYSAEELPELYPHKTFRDINIEAAQKVRDKKFDEWQKVKKELDADVAYAISNKQALPDNYWQTEHKARAQLETADQILKAAKEI